jgi:hypothetical protein
MAFKKFASIGQALQLHGLPYETEYKFHPDRKFRFDYALPELGVALEYEGVVSAKSRHTTLGGYAKDCEKYNEAALLGWLVFRFTVMNEESLIKVLANLKLQKESL